jgi:hypothetical protein
MSLGLGRRLARRRAVIVVPVAVALVAVAVGPSRAVVHAGGPFYFAPPPTDECKGLSNCSASVGPWVAVPAHGEATFLIGCPKPYGYLVGGTDARASSADIHVWFEGVLGSPIGRVSAQGAVLLFHAASGDGQAGSFRPILGCLTLKPKNKVSTIAFVTTRSVPGTAPGTITLRARTVPAKTFREHGFKYKARYVARCTKSEKFVGSWSAVAYETSTPPGPALLNAVSVRTVRVRDGVRAVIQESLGSLLLPEVEVQYGAMCGT